MLSRRAFIKTGLSLAGLSLVGSSLMESNTFSSSQNTALISAARNRQGQHFIQIVTMDGGSGGTIQAAIPIPARAHDIAARPLSNEVVVFDRRPGQFLYHLDWTNPGAHFTAISSHPQRHFYGHGVFSHDGRWLYTTENDLNNLSGVIGIYDASDRFRRVGEWPLKGVGPHELALMPDGETLVVALGGIKTHPDTGRKTLNPETLSPALLYINRSSGAELERQTFIDPRLSIRHLDISSQGQVAVGMQFQGDPEGMPLVALHRQGEPLKPVVAKEEEWMSLNGYIASVCFLSEADTLAVTTPRGNRIALIDSLSGELKTLIHNKDCAGAARINATELAVSNGRGQIQRMTCRRGEAEVTGTVQYADTQWDNHMLALNRA